VRTVRHYSRHLLAFQVEPVSTVHFHSHSESMLLVLNHYHNFRIISITVIPDLALVGLASPASLSQGLCGGVSLPCEKYLDKVSVSSKAEKSSGLPSLRLMDTIGLLGCRYHVEQLNLNIVLL
jgi:hypothetical protein